MAQCIALFCSIGEIYRKQGKLNEALTMHEEVLRVRASVFGLEHLDVATTKHKYADHFGLHFLAPMFVFLCSIGAVYYAQGKYDDALATWKDVLQVQEKTLGLEHPEPAKTKVHIAIVLRQQGQLQQALDKYHEALPVLEKTLGRNHLEPAKTRVNIANVYQQMGEYEKALDTYDLALPVLEATLGREHPVVANTKSK